MDAHRAAPRGLTRYVVTAGAAALAATAALAWDRPGPSWVPFLFLVALFVYAENTALDLPSAADELELHARDGRRRDLQGRRSPGRGGRHRAVRGPLLAARAAGSGARCPSTRCLRAGRRRGGRPLPRVPRVIAAQPGGPGRRLGRGGGGVFSQSTPWWWPATTPSPARLGSSPCWARCFAMGTCRCTPSLYWRDARAPLPRPRGRRPAALRGAGLVARQTFSAYLALRRAHEDTVRVLVGAWRPRTTTPPASGTGGPLRRVHGPRAPLRTHAPRAPPPRGADADVGKLIVPKPPAQQAGSADRGGVRAGAAPRARVGRDPHRHRLPRPVGRPRRASTRAFENVDEERPVEPFIVAVADAFDAMTSTRAYRKALSQTVALAELRDKAGTQFHPACVEALAAPSSAGGGLRSRPRVRAVAHRPAAARGRLGSAGLGDLIVEPGERSSG